MFVCMYRILPNFRGTNFSWIGLLQFFGRNKFCRSKDSHYPCPVLLVTCTICAHIRNNAMLGCSLPNPKVYALRIVTFSRQSSMCLKGRCCSVWRMYYLLPHPLYTTPSILFCVILVQRFGLGNKDV